MMSPGLWSLLPPLLAISLAMVTRRVILSLAIGVVSGAMTYGWMHGELDLPRTAKLLFVELLWTNLWDDDHLRVFGFTALMGAMVAVMHAAGGMQAVVDRLARFANNRRRGQLITWLCGLLIFFDDYANTLLLGTTMRPLADRLKISREKLAYLVDSTAAPVAGIAVISTWVATEIQYIDEGLAAAGAEQTGGVAVFLATVPYRFYPLLTLAFVALIGWSRRDFGPMLTAERAAQTHREHDDASTAGSRQLGHWTCAVLPILVTVILTVVILERTGRARPGQQSASLVQAIIHGDSYIALLGASLAGCLAAVLLALGFRACSPSAVGVALLRGVAQMLPALAILWLAWSIANLTEDDWLATRLYLAGCLGGKVATWFLPTLAFLVAAATAFATGTSWGTMAILMPLVIDFTWKLLDESGSASTHSPILLGSIGSVLAGAIMGDHCSPISDTTVLSSRASGCDHMQHVWTQMPYALAVGAVSIVCGTLPIGLGVNVWLLLPIGMALLAAAVYLFGETAERL